MKFITHGVLLVFYLLFIISAHLTTAFEPQNCGKHCMNIRSGIENLFAMIGSAIEQITFVFVVYSQVALTSAQKAQS